MKHRTLAALTILAVAAGFALAQPGPGTATPEPAAKVQAPMVKGMPGMQGPAMPDLTPEQQEKIDALRVAQVKQMAPMRADLRVKEIELDALWRADEPDAKKIIAKVKEIGGIKEKIEIARINHQFEVRKLLTPEQRKAMRKMGMRPGMMGRGMRRGMRGMMRGKMGGAGCGMQGGEHCGMQGPKMDQGGQQGCSGCKMH
jgi:Spy/CpxP family protein refolding chaperone